MNIYEQMYSIKIKLDDFSGISQISTLKSTKSVIKTKSFPGCQFFIDQNIYSQISLITVSIIINEVVLGTIRFVSKRMYVYLQKYL